MTSPLPVRGRLALLGALAILGLVAYVPAIRANASPPPDAGTVALPLGIGAIVVTLAALGGLRWADAAKLPMPWLRRLDGGPAASPSGRGLAVVTAASAAVGGVVVAILRGFGLDNLHGSLGTRLLTTLFAAVTLEVVIHLAAMSAVVRFTRSIALGIGISTALFVLFHAGGALGQPLAIAASVVLLNAAFGALLGVAYARLGFEAVILGHAIGHAIAIGFA